MVSGEDEVWGVERMGVVRWEQRGCGGRVVEGSLRGTDVLLCLVHVTWVHNAM